MMSDLLVPELSSSGGLAHSKSSGDVFTQVSRSDFRSGSGTRSRDRRYRASSLEPGTLHTCAECKYVTQSKPRFDEHFKQPRHVNQYRDRAYKDPKKRQIWLKVWFSQLEAAEMTNYEAFEVAEVEENDEETAADMMYRYDNATEIDRKVSSSSTCSTMSFQSSISSYD